MQHKSTQGDPDNTKGSGRKRKLPSNAFKPGQSGNPGGRPKKSEEQRNLEEMCRAKTPEALATILSIMDTGENERNRLSAAEFVIERGWGKAAQAVDLTARISVHENALNELE